MDQNRRSRLTRRAFIAQSALLGSAVFADPSVAYANELPKVVDLGNGIEVRDYRIFPSPDIRRFIVEVHNTTDTSIEAPALGLAITHDSLETEDGFATPTSPILHPDTSGLLFGVAPGNLVTDDDWRDPEWILCGEIPTDYVELFSDLSIQVTWDFKSLGTEAFEILAVVTNNGDDRTNQFALYADIFDESGRACGVAGSWIPWMLEADQSADVRFEVKKDSRLIGNPFVLVESSEQMSANITVQPRTRYRPISCPAIMPWNQ